MTHLKFALLIVASFATSVDAQEWPRFRGPNGNGLGAGSFPVQWTPQDLAWKVKLPGEGNSSPVLWGERIFVTAADAKGRHVVCVSARDGKTLWQRDFAGAKYKMHKRNTAATSTPAVDDKHVYVAFATPEEYTVLALDHAGKDVWSAKLGPYKSQHGFGASPIVHEGMVIIANEQDASSSLMALDAATGEVRWKLPRRQSNATYSTPCLYRLEGGSALAMFANWQHGITAVEPQQGKVVWEIQPFEPDKQERAIGSPIVAGDLVVATCGFITKQKHCVAVRPDGQGKPKEIWRFEKAVPQMSTPLAHGEHVFLFTEKGIGTCLDARTGAVLWSERLDGTFSASPVCAGGKLYCVSDDGEVFVLPAATKFEVLARNRLGEATQATPAIAGGRMIFRTSTHLMALLGK